MALAESIRRWLRPAYHTVKRKYQTLRVRRGVALAAKECRKQAVPVKVILGGSETNVKGWITTEVDSLDITKARDWNRYFSPDSIDCLFAEHVLEHLSEAQNRVGLVLCFRYLKPGGVFRIAVPDGHRRDQVYVDEVAPPKDGHQTLFTLETLTALLEQAGFETTPLEYFDAGQQFHAVTWDGAGGHVKRSVRYDTQLEFRRGNLYYTSLIVDASKPSAQGA